jgi:hypothetical protein
VSLAIPERHILKLGHTAGSSALGKGLRRTPTEPNRRVRAEFPRLDAAVLLVLSRLTGDANGQFRLARKRRLGLAQLGKREPTHAIRTLGVPRGAKAGWFVDADAWLDACVFWFWIAPNFPCPDRVPPTVRWPFFAQHARRIRGFGATLLSQQRLQKVAQLSLFPHPLYQRGSTMATNERTLLRVAGVGINREM